MSEAVRGRIIDVARQRGQKPEEFRRELEKDTPKHIDEVAEVIADSLDSLTASRSEKEIQSLRRTVKELMDRGYA